MTHSSATRQVLSYWQFAPYMRNLTSDECFAIRLPCTRLRDLQNWDNYLSQKNVSFSIFLHEVVVDWIILCNFVPTKPAFRGRAGQNLNGILRLSTPFVRTAKGERRFQNVTCLCSQTSQLWFLSTVVMQRSVCEGRLYSANTLLYIYIRWRLFI